MLACTKSNSEIVRVLLAAGANVERINKDGWNSFHLAVRYTVNLYVAKQFENSYFSFFEILMKKFIGHKVDGKADPLSEMHFAQTSVCIEYSLFFFGAA